MGRHAAEELGPSAEQSQVGLEKRDYLKI